MLTRALTGSGGSSAEIARTIRPSSITASSTSSSTYAASKSNDYNISVAGWAPLNTESNPWIVMDLGSSKDVKYVTFGTVTNSDTTDMSSKPDKTLDIYTSNDGNYSATADITQVLSYSNVLGHIMYVIPINKSVRYIKFLLEGTGHASYQGYKIEIYA